MATPKAPRMLVLDRAEQIAVVTHPLRLEILERIQIDGPDSIAGLAKKLDRKANALTYHVRLLENAGVLVPAGTRRAGRRDEIVYRAAADGIAVGGNPRSKTVLRAATKSAAAVLRLAEREIRRAVESGMDRRPNLTRPLGRRQKTWLTDADLAAAHQRLTNLGNFLEKCTRKKRGRPYALTVVLVPLGPERKS